MDTRAVSFADASKLFGAMSKDSDFLSRVHEASESIISALKSGNTILIAGNGGSAAQAQHFAAEIVGRYKRERRGYPSVALTTDTSALTAIGNDYGFEKVFSRQIEALGKKGDVFVALSTSGNSQNLIEALKVAHEHQLVAVSLLGKDGGTMKGTAQIDLIVPSQDTAHIQEAHLAIIHSICEAIDAALI